MKILKRVAIGLAAIAALAPAAAAARQTALPEGPGKAILETTCAGCHDLGVVSAKRATTEEWQETIEMMTGFGAVVEAADADVLVEYLATHFGPAADGSAPADAAPAAASENYDVNMEWAQLPPGMSWDASTSSVAADGEGRVIVLVRTAPYFRVFTREGEFVTAWGEDEDLFTLAHSVMVDHEGFVWATDSDGHAVYKFSPEGTLLMTLGEKGVAGDNSSRDLFNRPNAVDVAPNGDIFVSDGYGNSRIVQFTEDGEFIRMIGGENGSEPGQLNLPHGVVVDSEGRVIVGDSDNGRISVFEADGTFVETWDVPSRGGMVIGPDDTVYVSDVNANAIHVVKDGEIVEVIGGLGRVHGITLDGDGTLYGSDSLNRQVMKITPKP